MAPKAGWCAGVSSWLAVELVSLVGVLVGAWFETGAAGELVSSDAWLVTGAAGVVVTAASLVTCVADTSLTVVAVGVGELWRLCLRSREADWCSERREGIAW